MALQNGRKQAGLEAREQRDVAALAGDVVNCCGASLISSRKRAVCSADSARMMTSTFSSRARRQTRSRRADLFRFQKRNLGIGAGLVVSCRLQCLMSVLPNEGEKAGAFSGTALARQPDRDPRTQGVIFQTRP